MIMVVDKDEDDDNNNNYNNKDNDDNMVMITMKMSDNIDKTYLISHPKQQAQAINSHRFFINS